MRNVSDGHMPPYRSQARQRESSCPITLPATTHSAKLASRATSCTGAMSCSPTCPRSSRKSKSTGPPCASPSVAHARARATHLRGTRPGKRSIYA